MVDDAYVYTIKREHGIEVSVNFAGFKKVYRDVNQAAEVLPITGAMLDIKLDEKRGEVHLSINDEGKVVWM